MSCSCGCSHSSLSVPVYCLCPPHPTPQALTTLNPPPLLTGPETAHRVLHLRHHMAAGGTLIAPHPCLCTAHDPCPLPFALSSQGLKELNMSCTFLTTWQLEVLAKGLIANKTLAKVWGGMGRCGELKLRLAADQAAGRSPPQLCR